MSGRISILKFLLTVVGGTLLGGLALGLFGFLLAGKEGFVNMVSWGLAIGFLGSLSTGFAMLVNTHFWKGYAQRFGKESFKKISEGEDNKPDY
jgi:hypothetical protein